MTVSTAAQGTGPAGLVAPGSREHLWAAYEAAIGDWERAGAVERAQYAAYEFAAEAWRQKRAEELDAWRRTREAFEAWQQAADAEPAEPAVRETQRERQEVS